MKNRCKSSVFFHIAKEMAEVFALFLQAREMSRTALWKEEDAAASECSLVFIYLRSASAWLAHMTFAFEEEEV